MKFFKNILRESADFILRQVQSVHVEKNKCGICGLGSNEEDSDEYVEDGEENNLRTEVEEMEILDWVQCERCNQWFHCNCMEIDPEDEEQTQYFHCGCIGD